MGWTFRWRRLVVDVGVLVMVLGTVVGCTPAPPKRQATPEPPETVSSQVFAPPSDSVSPDTGVAPPTSSVPVTSAAIYDCDAQPVERPAQFILLCGDAGETLVHLVWSGWGRTSASATGQVVVKSCTPDCADGTSIPYVATVTITGLSGGIYTKMHLSAPRAPVPAQNFAVDTDGPVALTRLPTGY